MLPDQVNGLAGAGADAADVAVGPGSRQRRQWVHQMLLRAQQHFHHSGTASKIAVYLERRMGIQQIGVSAAATASIGTAVIVGADIA